MATKARRTRYYVKTWDTYKTGFTPQKGVRKGPYTLFGLRKAIRKLRAMGYPCDYSSRLGKTAGDPAVLVYSDAPEPQIELPVPLIPGGPMPPWRPSRA